MRLVWSYMRRHLGMFAACLVLLVVDTTADLVLPTLMSLAVDEGVVRRDVGRVLFFGAVMLAVAALGCVCVLARNRLSVEVGQAVGSEMRADAYRALLGSSAAWADRMGVGPLVTRLTNDVAAVVDLVMSLMRIAVRMPYICVVSVVFIVYQTPWMTPALAVCVAAAGVFIYAGARAGAPRFARMQASIDRLNSASREFLSSVRVVKSFGAEGQETARLKAASGAYTDAAVSSMRVEAVTQPLVSLCVNLGVVALLWLAQAQDASQVGRLMASVNYLAQLAMSMGLVGGVVNRTVRAQACAARIGEVLRAERAEEPEAEAGAGASVPTASQAGASLPAAPQAGAPTRSAGASPAASAAPAARGGIELRDVCFSYEGSPRAALSHVSAEVGPGRTLGVVGPTGSGKTTLVRLLLRLYAPASGSIAVCGRDLAAIPEDELRSLVCVVPQAPSLFSGTVADNLRWGDDHADEAALRAALEAACADGFVSRMPGGLEAMLGQGGVNLSGGQRQRLCIARALLRRPQVLLLDDCTSALDGATERRVLDNLRRLCAGTTVVLVSQRVSTVRGCDAVLCLEAGRPAGYGPHARLVRESPLYRLICTSQGVAVPGPEPAGGASGPAPEPPAPAAPAGGAPC